MGSPLARRCSAKAAYSLVSMRTPSTSLLWKTRMTSSVVMCTSNSLPQNPLSCAALSDAMEFSAKPAASQFQYPLCATIAVLPFWSILGKPVLPPAHDVRASSAAAAMTEMFFSVISTKVRRFLVILCPFVEN